MMASCGENTTPAVGSVAPMLGFQDSDGYGATPGEYYGTVAMIRSCIIVHGINVKAWSDIGSAVGTSYGNVVVMDTPGANNNTGSAFDSAFNFKTGVSGSSVVISGDGARGLVKAAVWSRAAADGNVKFLGSATANYVPLFPQASHSAWNFIANRADAGTQSSAGGFAVTGLAAPVVRDTAFNPSDPNGVVATFSFTGGGRSVISYDGGQSWECLGLEETRTIHRILINPSNTDEIYVGATGSAWGDSPRGVYKSTDGGKNWTQSLYIDGKTGAGDLVMDPNNPKKLIANMWEYRRAPWFFTSGGPSGGLFITYDGGEHWKKLGEEDGRAPCVPWGSESAQG